MRVSSSLITVLAVLLVIAPAATAQVTPRSYADVVENDYPAVQLRFGKGAPASLVPGENRVSLLSGAGFTAEGVNLFGDYTVEWWQMVPNMDRAYPVARIGGRDIGVVPLPPKKEKPDASTQPAKKKEEPARGYFSTGDPNVRSETIVYPGKWYHVAVVVLGPTTQIYVNGFPEKLIEKANRPTGELRLGSDIPGNARRFGDGEMAVYDYALPPQRIRAHFNAGLAALARQKPVVVAHRGVHKYAPENTRISYVQAVEAGAPIVEFDTALTKDGHIVGLHDKTVDRTTGATGKIAEMTLEEARKLEAGSWKDPKYEGEPIPTIDEVAEVVRGKAKLMLDLKAEGQGPAIAAWLEKSRFPRDQVILAPWTDEEGAALRQHVKDVPMIRLTSKVPAEQINDAYFDRMKEIGFSGFSVNWQYLTQRFVDGARRNGMTVYVWTLNDNPDIAGATLLGVDGIVTDDSAATRKTIEQLFSAASAALPNARGAAR